MNDDTPFHVWMNSAVDEMQTAINGMMTDAEMRVHLFRCFQALVKVMEKVSGAEQSHDKTDMVR